MNKTFYGHTPNVNLDRGDTHIHNINARRYKVYNYSATYLWHCRLGHIGVNCEAHEETPCGWTFGIT